MYPSESELSTPPSPVIDRPKRPILRRSTPYSGLPKGVPKRESVRASPMLNFGHGIAPSLQYSQAWPGIHTNWSTYEKRPKRYSSWKDEILGAFLIFLFA
jgi:hypothetical protein